jgi:hypothetical protein
MFIMTAKDRNPSRGKIWMLLGFYRYYSSSSHDHSPHRERQRKFKSSRWSCRAGESRKMAPGRAPLDVIWKRCAASGRRRSRCGGRPRGGHIDCAAGTD